ncbi:MAG: proline--tRNA ligase [Alphaproteobacteria bacterium]|nr:proline--tRNA ligase [Alphaproteobacteria bacterium]
MRLSRYFLPLLKENPKEAQIVSHQLMLRAGMIRQQVAGIYSWLPLGMTVLEHVERIVAEELDKVGCVRLLMPTLQSTELWKESGRYDALGKEMLRFNDRAERELLYSPTCEEMIVDIFRSYVKSYKHLPLNLYQIQWKFRDEVRPRFGVMRGREFLMKDGYSFHASLDDAKREYSAMYDAYHAIFRRLGLTAIAVAADSGAIGGNLSHEFQVLAETGESQIYYDPIFDDVREGKVKKTGEEMRNYYAAADELHKPDQCPVPADKLRTARGIEVGHIFLLGSKYTDAMNVNVMGDSGTDVRVQMGTYGIGVSRLVGAIIEASHDANGIIWPESVAPFDVGLINIRFGDEGCDRACEEIYAQLQAQGIKVLFDDTDKRGGEKFAGMDLIGVPWQIVIGPRSAAEGKVEIKYRRTGEKSELPTAEAVAMIAQKLKAARA